MGQHVIFGIRAHRAVVAVIYAYAFYFEKLSFKVFWELALIELLEHGNAVVGLTQLFVYGLPGHAEEGGALVVEVVAIGVVQLLEIEGIGIDYGNYGSVRSYPENDMLAHTLGYVGIVSAGSDEELEARLKELNEGRDAENGLYTSDSYVGRNGLEAKYEKELRGNDGYHIYICTSQGTNRRTLYTKPAEDGLDLQLTIDYKLQKRLDFVLDSVLFGETTAGAAVVMNPKTGAIEAMSSWPGYDLNAFAKGISSADYAELLSKANKPLYNRLTQGLYPPGSVLKAFTAVAALQSGTLDENYVFTGEIVDDYWLPTDYGTWLGSKIKRTQVKYGRLSPLNMRSAIVHSDNIYFANAALLMGWDNYTSYMKSIGFGDTMPFDLNVAQSQLYNDDTELTLMLLADSGYGQGEILTTPLQMATMFCAFANGGNIMQPYIVDGLYETEGIKYNNVSRASPKVWKSGVIEQHSLDIIVPYLKDVVDHNLNGTGRSLKVTSVTVAAKTGTAEIGNDKSRQISWFAGFRCDTEDKDARLVLALIGMAAACGCAKRAEADATFVMLTAPTVEPIVTPVPTPEATPAPEKTPKAEKTPEDNKKEDEAKEKEKDKPKSTADQKEEKKASAKTPHAKDYTKVDIKKASGTKVTDFETDRIDGGKLSQGYFSGGAITLVNVWSTT